MLNILSCLTSGYIDADRMPKIESFYAYLEAAGVSFDLIEKISESGYITSYKDIPSLCWDNSILKPYTYYYHSNLRSVSPPVRFDTRTGKMIDSGHYNEMKIALTETAVISDMYETLSTLDEFKHLKRDVEGLKFVLNKHPYVMIEQLRMETIDVIYTMIQNALMRSGFNRLSFLDLYNANFNNTILTIEEKHITPQKSFTLRTGELVVCHGK